MPLAFIAQHPTPEGENCWLGYECLLSTASHEVFIETFIKQTLKNILLECNETWPQVMLLSS